MLGYQPIHILTDSFKTLSPSISFFLKSEPGLTQDIAYIYEILQSSRNMPDMPDMSGRLLLMSGRGLKHCRTNVRQGSIHRECPARETRIAGHIYRSSLRKMSDRGPKCPAEHWRPAGHFVRQTWNNFREDWILHCNHFIIPSNATAYETL